MKRFIVILTAVLFLGCNKAPALSEVLVGEWELEHYEAYLDGNPTTAVGSLDRSIKFSPNGNCNWNGGSSFSYTLSGNTITLHNEKVTTEYKVTYFTESRLVWYFYVNKYKVVYYLQRF